MTECDGLFVPAEGDDLGVIAQKWGNAYSLCKLKHQILKDCVEQYENQDNKKPSKN